MREPKFAFGPTIMIRSSYQVHTPSYIRKEKSERKLWPT
ncbi:hypothetical protein Pint_22758 [Pistacia integerrima]|uniref:Uncharacterized protein n=1 Tax=Pistacia integerrima TaxID=434235 RepID=A0ACC0YJF8_9ROSI|nr:hypothetical protein Pint_22758 [Pistacia integerrima]